ncbi:MAG: CPBP family intramembrane metalloprotease [bacterium]|nr:CPBP family intramembrane metalloprotease [bacterium]
MNRTIVLRIIGVILAASLLACVLYSPVFAMVASWDWTYPPDRVFRRVWMLSVIAGLIGGGRWLGFRHPARVGYRFSAGWARNVAWGAIIAWGFLGALTGLYLLGGAWRFQHEYNLTKALIAGLIRGALVAGLEEYVFRGLIYSSLRVRWSWFRAAAFCSAIFASLHFLTGAGHAAVEAPDAWWMGFYLCGTMTLNMLYHFTPFPDALSLFFVGMILCYAVEKTRTLWYGVGLHGGWVWCAAVLSEVFSRTGRIDTYYIGGSRLFDGVIPMAGMAVVFPITWWLIHRGWAATQPDFESE